MRTTTSLAIDTAVASDLCLGVQKEIAPRTVDAAGGLAQEAESPMQGDSLTARHRRDTAWKRDGRARGIYWRARANGSKAWGFYADGRIHSAPSRQAALDGKAKAALRK